MRLWRTLLRTPLPGAIALCFCMCGIAEAQSVAGSVVGASGQTGVSRGGQRLPLPIGAPVYVGDTVEVGPDGKLKLRMADGSILSLAPSSNLRIDSYLVAGSGRRQGPEV